MTLEQTLKLDIFQERDARTFERKLLNEILDKNNPSENMEVV